MDMLQYSAKHIHILNNNGKENLYRSVLEEWQKTR